ncbi:AAA family ATPase [Hydrogenoanaerobacterium saccharovorans]|uniref:AAA family ATPase n=1 Tax=Hydrogenoanaerobacterium saccharovorans TaxID=474960 RepID=A0ABS2GR90_9FIRM|nr:ATP-binding protein [Hydrogenoanaerobacterium saccharovorans]MBM6924089.1 AAA family ATPase [Hydrogenoanaerobacterium saccharovorans]
MLKLFEVTGFKNFEKTLRLDFSDVRDYKFNDFCVVDGLLSKLIVYGKNSSGKSNLGLALFDIVSHLTTNNVTPGLYDYYLNINNKSGYAEFHYVFKFGNDEVDYRYRKNDKQSLMYEFVAINGKRLFDYNYDFGIGNLSGLEAVTTTLNLSFRDNDSMLKYVINNSALPNNHPLYQMQRFVSRMLWFRSLDENRYIGYKKNSKDYYDFIFKENMLMEFESFLHKAGIQENLIAINDADGTRRLYFDTPKPLPFFKVASSGTKALYTFFYWYKTSADVSLMFIDEFDAFYHYELSETLVDLLEHKSGFQTILTSHNTNLLSNRIMRPDCYFILAQGELTSFANATDRELREGHNLEKLYMSGEFNG